MSSYDINDSMMHWGDILQINHRADGSLKNRATRLEVIT